MSKAKRIEQDETADDDTVIDNVVDLPRTVSEQVAERRDTAIAFVKEHPGLAIAGGIAVGIVAAALFPRRPRSRLGKRGAKLGDAVSATAALLAREAVSRAEVTGKELRRGSRKAARRSEDLGEQAARSIGAFLVGLLSRASELGESASDGAEKAGRSAAKRLVKAGDAAENVAVLAGRRIGRAAHDARSRIIG